MTPPLSINNDMEVVGMNCCREKSLKVIKEPKTISKTINQYFRLTLGKIHGDLKSHVSERLIQSQKFRAYSLNIILFYLKYQA